MNFYSYKLDHDYGLAPNPFGEYCTLAVCKGKIRSNKNLSLKDWIIGTGSKALSSEHKLIYIMQVEEIISFDQYWEDERFQYKKPVLNGSLVQIHGDNIYHKDKNTGEWIQENSAHSGKDGCLNQDHLDADIKGKNVLISKNFYYLGDKAVEILEPFQQICTDSRDMMYKSIDLKFGGEFIKWVKANFNKGVSGDPISWKEYLK